MFLICNTIRFIFYSLYFTLGSSVRLILLIYLFSFENMKQYYDSISQTYDKKKSIFKELLLSHPCYTIVIIPSLPVHTCQTPIGNQFIRFWITCPVYLFHNKQIHFYFLISPSSLDKGSIV